MNECNVKFTRLRFKRSLQKSQLPRKLKTILKKFDTSYRGKSQLVDYQNSARLFCPFEMRNELFGDEFSEGVYFKLEFRLDFRQPRNFLDVNKCIQLF